MSQVSTVNATLKAFVLGAGVAALGLGVYALAVSVPNTFTSGTTISSTQMNANFTALKAAVDALEAKTSLPGKTGRYGYAWASQPGTASYTVNTGYEFNSGGGAITATRSAAGTYSITFAGLGGATDGGHVQVTAYGSDNVFCKTAGWNSGPANFVATVRCYSTAGVLTDSRYDIQVSW